MAPKRVLFLSVMRMNSILKSLLLNLLVVATVHTQSVIPPPTNVTAQGVSANHPRVVLSWQTAPGTWYCNLYRSMNDTLHFTRIAQVPGRTFEDRGVVGGRTYYYYLKAVAWRDSSILESQQSNIAVASLGPSSGVRGTIRGTVVDDSTDLPIRGVRVRFFRQGTNWTGEYDVSDSLGVYEAVVDTGRYLIKAEPPCEPNTLPQYRPEWFNNAPEPYAATVVVVAPAGTSTADFRLQRLSVVRLVSVSGVVHNEQGQPIANATVALMRSIQEMNRLAASSGTIPGLGTEARQLPGIGYTRGVIWSGTTDQQGRFRAVVPQNGSYIAAAGKPGFLLQYYDRTTDPTRARLIAAAADTSGVSFQLRQTPPYPNTINGVVRDTTGDPVPSRVILFPRPPQGQPPTQIVHSGSGGEYTFTGLAAGSYMVLALPFSNYGPAFYARGEFGVVQWQLADSVVVGPGNGTAHIGVLPIQSRGLATASGVALASTGEPLAGGRILVRDASGTLVGAAINIATGAFIVEALPFGDVTFIVDREPFNTQFVPVYIPPNTYAISNINIVLTRSNLTGMREPSMMPQEYSLEQNHPNPFNPATLIAFSLPASHVGVVRVSVFDVLGREVATLVNEQMSPGRYEIVWSASGGDAHNFASGVYFYRLTAGSFTQTKRLMLLR